MITTSAKYKTDLYSAVDEYLLGSITLTNGTVIPLNSDNIEQNTCTFRESACSSGFGVGGLIADQLDIGLFITTNNPFLLTKSELTLQKTFVFDDDTTQTIPIGTFYVDNSTVKRTRNKITFTAYNGAVLFDKTIGKSTTKSGTPYALLQWACTACGVTLGTGQSAIQAMANGNRSFSWTKQENTYTYRDMLTWLLQLLGGFGRINRSTGKLEVVPFSSTADFTVDEENSISRNVSDTSVTVTAVQYGETLVGSSTTGFMLDLSGNVFIEALSNKSTVLSAIRTYLNGVEFYNSNVTWFGDLSVQAGDCFTYSQEELYGGSRKVIVMESVWRSQGNCTLTSYGDNSASAYSPVSRQALANAETLNYLKVNYLDAQTIEANYLLAETAEITYATIANLNATTATVAELQASKADLTYVTANFAEIDLSNIANGTITNAMIANGAIDTAQIADASITDAKIVELTASKITAGTLSVERLEIRGSESSIVYELNNITGALQSQNVDTLNGEILTPRTITADKVVANAITANEIAGKTITSNEIMANSITATELNVTSLSAITANLGTVTAGEIRSSNYDITTLTGMVLHLNSGTWHSKYFTIGANGVITATGGTIGGFTLGTTTIKSNTGDMTLSNDGVFTSGSTSGLMTKISSGAWTMYNSNRLIGSIGITQFNSTYKLWTFMASTSSSIAPISGVSFGGGSLDGSAYIIATGNVLLQQLGYRHNFYDTVKFYGTLGSFVCENEQGIYGELTSSGSTRMLTISNSNNIVIGNSGQSGNTYIYSSSDIIMKSGTATVGTFETNGLRFPNNYGILINSSIAFRYYSSALWCGSSNYPLKLVGSTITSNGSTVTSDRRLKNSISDISSNYLALIDNIKAKTYSYNSDKSHKTNVGFIAQDVLQALTDCGMSASDFGGFCDVYGDGREYAIDYCQFIPIMWEIIKNLKRKVDNYENISK